MDATSMIVDHTRIGAAFRRLSIPVAVQMLGDQLLGTVDTIAIGSLGAVALAGATAALTIFIAIAFVAYGFMSGVALVAAQRIGAGDVEGFARTVRAGAVVPLLFAIIAFAASLAGANPAIHALVGALPSARASATYLVLRCAALVPMVISGTLIVGLGAAGNRQVGVLVLVVVNVVHIPLLMMLGLGWWTHHPFGIVGAGVSSLISESIAACYAIFYVARRPAYRVFSHSQLSWRLALRCAMLGLPEAIFLLGVTAPDIFIVALLAPLGAIAIAAFRALNVVSDLTFVVPSPLQSAAQVVIGQRLGARDPAGARSFFERALRFSLVVTTLTGAVVAILAWPLAYIFTLDAAIASIAALPLALHMVTMPIKGWAMLALAPIRASGDTRFSMTVGLFCSALVIPLVWIGIERLHLGLYSVALGWIAAWTVRALLTQWKLRDGAWMRRAPLAA
ncbi:MAG TPA: MATE family efflux transporter [Candidatus Cybelea sp.]|jgi:MATE family multidrug resistance protein|nr:MATE family efflux transporter [Candidatus Cybelea sp.]